MILSSGLGNTVIVGTPTPNLNSLWSYDPVRLTWYQTGSPSFVLKPRLNSIPSPILLMQLPNDFDTQPQNIKQDYQWTNGFIPAGLCSS